ncbi:hypothetical protein K439DRAFT_1532343 [Ramaria rubella]|nr:hypothetical protein K439DRAFT_1532343 [Ramaria rubella]
MSSSTKQPFGGGSPNSSHTSEPTPKHQCLDTVRLSISEEEYAEQDQKMNRALIVRELVETEDGLMKELQEAWSKKRNVAECVASLNPVLDRRPVIAPPPTTNYNVQDSPPTGLDIISNEIDEFCQVLKPQLKNFIVKGEHAIPRWSIKDKGTFYDHMSALRIPMLRGQTSLLLHNLGELVANDEENVSVLFNTSGSVTFFCNVSGSGKTRMLLQGLYRTWGFYLVCQVDSNGIGSRDLATAISRLLKMKGWTEPLPKSQRATLSASNSNDQFKTVLLAHLIILNLFLTICKEHQGITDEAKGLWMILQVNPTIFDHLYDIFDERFQLLVGITEFYLQKQFLKELLAANKRLPSWLICVIDEAQAAARSLEQAFISSSKTSSPQSQPVLKSLSNLMISYSFQVILSGTYISIDKIGTAVASGSMKIPKFQLFHEMGSLDNVQNHATYMERYLPASLLQGEAGKQLLRQSWHWLCGCYQFTAVFVMLLLQEGGHSPHTILDYLVHHIRGYWLNDSMDTYLLKDASKIVFRYMTGRKVLPTSHEYPKTWVELGFARFLHNSVSINENLTILSLAQWLEEQCGFTLKDFLNDAVNDLTKPQIQGYMFQDVLTFHLYSAFQDFVKLKKAFNFICPVPEWASQRARLITFTCGKDREYQWAGVNSHHLEKPRLPTVPMAVGSSSADNEAVVLWLKDQEYIPIFLPTDLMGPDHILLMELEDGQHVWLVIQVKFVNSMLATAKLEAAVKTVTPPFLRWDNLRTGTQDTMNNVPNPVSGNPLVLHVITNVCGVKAVELSADKGPLAIMDLKHFQSTTWKSVVDILGAALPHD